MSTPLIPYEPFEDHLDDEIEPEEDDYDEADCGRWRNGVLVAQCLNAGTEWCDWECPIGC
jgi:hypothetical protein